jgi:hypothetical protein
MELADIELEPVCWRGYAEDGKNNILKPDMFAVTVLDKYEYFWFIEMDLATESPCTVVDKCKRYACYHTTGKAQKQYGVFPMVVWLVPSAARKASLQKHISESRDLPFKEMFSVITPDELEGLLQNKLIH